MEGTLIPELGTVGLLFIGLFLFAWILQRWRVPALLGFIFCGFLFQNYPSTLLTPLFRPVGEVAVWLLFFFIGLEYSPEHLARLSRSITRPGLIDFGLNFGLLTAVALLFSEPLEAVLLGSALYPSSTAIIARLLLDYGRLANPEAELLLGLLIFEDIVGVTLLGILTPLAQGKEVAAAFLLQMLGALAAMVILFWVLHKWIIPWVARSVPSFEDEPFVVFLTLGMVLAAGASGHAIGLSGALTTFLLGVLLPEGSSLFRTAEKSLIPIRELSVGLFFFALSYSVEVQKLPFALGVGWLGLSLLLKSISTYWAARIWGLQPKTAFRAALSFLPKGEFSLLFGVLSLSWHSTILLLVIGSSVIGTLAFATSDQLIQAVFPRKKQKAIAIPESEGKLRPHPLREEKR
ncbi:MAG: cation:proton antiporter [Bacteroidia bacterium]|nr:cation:proton antiporter [Bacteroidia bacterium]MDW8015423.1 cation:proton antiporter [Bacteroidia bacterium]